MPQVSATIDQNTYDAIVEMSDKEKRNISSMVNILLSTAIKERLRNRKRRNKNGEKEKV